VLWQELSLEASVGTSAVRQPRDPLARRATSQSSSSTVATERSAIAPPTATTHVDRRASPSMPDHVHIGSAVAVGSFASGRWGRGDSNSVAFAPGQGSQCPCVTCVPNARRRLPAHRRRSLLTKLMTDVSHRSSFTLRLRRARKFREPSRSFERADGSSRWCQ
jgi:hypothetical protein